MPDLSQTSQYISGGGGALGGGIGDVKRENQGMEAAAYSESERNQYNAGVEARNIKGNMQLGGAVGGVAGGAIAGAEFGTAFGPIGTAIGGIAGGLMSGLFH